MAIKSNNYWLIVKGKAMTFYTNRVIKLGSYFLKKVATENIKDAVEKLIDNCDHGVPSDSEFEKLNKLIKNQGFVDLVKK